MDIKDKNLYYIGGIVRDELLGKESFDIDITYIGNAIEYAKTIPNAEIIQINEPFGTVRIKYKGKEIDIASTRKEAYPNKGHLPIVEDIGCSLKEDILRRDFTINALAKSTETGEIIDYAGGLEDLKNKTIRVLHNNSFVDDPTRIVRALKFSVRLGFELDNHTKELQNKYLENVNYDMSYKRLKKELIETFNLNSQTAFEKFIKQKIYKLITKTEVELPNTNFENLINKYNPNNIWIIYAGLIPEIEKLPLTKTEKEIVEDFYKIKNVIFNSDFEIFKTFSNLNTETIIMYAQINEKITTKFLDNLQHIKLEISGKDLLELGQNPSPKYQECFDYILSKKITNPQITRNEELKLAKDFYNLT